MHWSLNKFTKVVSENFFQIQSEFSVQSKSEKILMENHYKTIFGPVRTVGDKSRVLKCEKKYTQCPFISIVNNSIQDSLPSTPFYFGQ